jgi:hypothetical protein
MTKRISLEQLDHEKAAIRASLDGDAADVRAQLAALGFFALDDPNADSERLLAYVPFLPRLARRGSPLTNCSDRWSGRKATNHPTGTAARAAWRQSRRRPTADRRARRSRSVAAASSIDCSSWSSQYRRSATDRRSIAQLAPIQQRLAAVEERRQWRAQLDRARVGLRHAGADAKAQPARDPRGLDQQTALAHPRLPIDQHGGAGSGANAIQLNADRRALGVATADDRSRGYGLVEGTVPPVVAQAIELAAHALRVAAFSAHRIGRLRDLPPAQRSRYTAVRPPSAGRTAPLM